MSSKESSKQWHGGKGSQRRGNDIKAEEAYRSNWDRIFGGIDYEEKSLKEGLYHYNKMKERLPQGKNVAVSNTDTVFKPKQT